ncbi:MAG: alpha/beta fold hydrolase [Thermomicrobiales bacterium]
MVEQQETRQAGIGHGGGRGPREGRVEANGIGLRYLDWSGPASSSRPSVVLLHGVLQRAEGMANLAAHLSRRTRVVAPDLRGRGGSDQPHDGYDPATMADDVAGLIEALDLDRPVVIGRMHGGLVGWHVCARRSDLVRGLVIGDTPPEVDEQRAAWALQLIRDLPPRFAMYEDALRFYQEQLQLSEARARHDIPSDLAAEADGSLSWRHNLALVERIEAASMPRAEWDVLARIACPTLLLRGQRGMIPVEMSERICQTITKERCQVRTVIGCGHDVFLGPGCEQSFGAIDLFLMGVSNAAANGKAMEAAPLAPQVWGATTDGAVERIVAAINSHDPDAIAALFAADCRVVEYGEGGCIRDGGIDAVHATFAQIFDESGAATMEVRDVIADEERVACVFAIHKSEATTIVAPAFFRLRDGQVAEFVSYHLHVPAGDA